MFEARLAQLAEQRLLRRLRMIESETGPLVTFEGRPVVLMASNDYLGLATHPALKEAAIEATRKFGVGCGASRLVSGTLPPHQQLEQALAEFKGTEAALLFGSGYLANIGLIPALVGQHDLILADRLCHASLIDGCRLSGADLRVFKHCDFDHLHSLLEKRAPKRKTLIVTDGVFSMDGDVAPLPDLVRLAEQYGAQLLIDDAHGTGVMGNHGRGSLEHFGVESMVPFHMGTLSKALGTSGAYVVGPTMFIQYVVNTTRSFIYTTASPPATVAASLAALRILRSDPARRARLWKNRDYFADGLKNLGFCLTRSQTPILPIVIGDSAKASTMAELLLEHGVLAPAIRPPTVPRGSSRIRTTVSSEHTREQLDLALLAFRTAGRKLDLI